ncbi:MAG TPA: ABC transporter ATP-binding protein [Candidatus Hydrogenedentes bacterium]|nr:ABC transporter ATP-binding protein [Candidatus Hydrogenedentota bacterium]
MSVIELRDVEVCYEDLKALNGVTCSIDGGTVGLLGPNGAGKSTLLKTLLGFNRATKGSVTVFGMDMPKNALKVRMQLGYMPERESVSPKVSAVSFITYCGRLFGMSRVDAMERTHEVLNYVGLGEARYRKMETYSTGMLQRVKLAQALVHDPKLLLLDEPTNGLDPQGRIELLELIKEVAGRRKVTIILSSHLLPDIQHVCDNVILIQGGVVALAGSIDELTAVVDRCFEVRIRDNKDGFLTGLAEAGFTWQDQQDGNLFVTAPDNTDPRTLFEIARARETQIRHFRPARHSLTEIFTQAAGKE